MDLVLAVLAVNRHAESHGFDPANLSRVSTAASELGRNILKYATGGYLLLRDAQQPGMRGIEIEVRDGGPGIEDLDLALRENVSTGGTLGLGLPGVRRLMDEFEISSSPQGTRVTVRKWS